MAQHVKQHEKSDSKKLALEGNDEEADKAAVQPVIETKGARKEREKAEWERLSFVEKFVKKYLPSQINSIAIFVNS